MIAPGHGGLLVQSLLYHGPLARGCHHETVEINLESTDASGVVDVALHGPAAEILTSLDEAVRRFS